MKKILLILLLLPMVAIGQDDADTTTVAISMSQIPRTTSFKFVGERFAYTIYHPLRVFADIDDIRNKLLASQYISFKGNSGDSYSYIATFPYSFKKSFCIGPNKPFKVFFTITFYNNYRLRYYSVSINNIVITNSASNIPLVNSNFQVSAMHIAASEKFLYYYLRKSLNDKEEYELNIRMSNFFNILHNPLF